MILVNVAAFNPHPRFMPEFAMWYAHITRTHEVSLHWPVQRTGLHRVQAAAVQGARACGASHILWIEDDHWGFPKNALDHLLAADKDHIGLWTYQKTPPYKSLAMRKREPGKVIDLDTNAIEYDCIEPTYGTPQIQPVDLVGFGFTLTKVDVFDAIPNPFGAWRQKPTDTVLCEYMLAAGLQPHVSFRWALPHGDVSPDKRQADLTLRYWLEGRVSLTDKELKTYTARAQAADQHQTELREYEMIFTDPGDADGVVPLEDYHERVA